MRLSVSLSIDCQPISTWKVCVVKSYPSILYLWIQGFILESPCVWCWSLQTKTVNHLNNDCVQKCSRWLSTMVIEGWDLFSPSTIPIKNLKSKIEQDRTYCSVLCYRPWLPIWYKCWASPEQNQMMFWKLIDLDNCQKGVYRATRIEYWLQLVFSLCSFQNKSFKTTKHSNHSAI